MDVVVALLLGEKVLFFIENGNGVWGKGGEKFRLAGPWRMTGSALKRWTLWWRKKCKLKPFWFKPLSKTQLSESFAMAIPCSVLVLASLLFVAVAVSGSRDIADAGCLKSVCGSSEEHGH